METDIAQASFRDPAGAVVVTGDRVFRVVGAAGRDAWTAFSSSSKIRELEATGKIVATRPLDDAAASAARSVPSVDEAYRAIDGKLLIEHERIPFPSYPYEWPPEMLEAAGMLTLELNDTLLDEGCGLKDSTPYNVMFRGAAPVFLDVLSCEPRQPTDPIWIAEAQFQRTFVLPLLAYKHLGIGLHQTFLTHRLRLVHRELRWRSQVRDLRRRTQPADRVLDLRSVLRRSQTPIAVHVGTHERLDGTHARHIASLPCVDLKWHPAGHNVAKHLRDTGQLEQVVRDAVEQ